MTDFETQPIPGAPLGARISGINLGEPLDQHAVEKLHRALLDFQVLVFPNRH